MSRNFTDRLELEQSAFGIRSIPNYRIQPEWYDITTSRLLSCVDEFHEDVKAVRRSLLKGEIVPYPDGNFFGLDYDEEGILPMHLFLMLDWAIESTSDKGKLSKSELRSQLDITVDKLLDKYKLTHRWRFPIEILVLTDILTLPLNSPIYVQAPIRTGGILEVTRNRLEGITSRAVDSKTKLTIVITEQMTISEIVRHIENDETVKDGLLKLPKAIKPRIGDNVMYWGHLAWAIKKFQDPNLSWDGVVERLIELKPNEEVPDRQVISVYYKRFLDGLNNFS